MQSARDLRGLMEAFQRASGWARGALFALWPVILLLTFALILRLVVIPPAMTVDVSPLIGDEGNYLGIAQSLATGHGIPDRWPWLRVPGYPLLLAAAIRLGGMNLRIPMLLQAGVGTITVGLTAAIAHRLWGRRAAIFACAWAAVNLSLIFYTQVLMTDVIATLLVAVLAYALVRHAQAESGSGWLAVAAVAGGLALLVRPALLSALPFIALWIGWREWRSGWRVAIGRVALFAELIVVLVAPITAYNWHAYHHFIPLDTTPGYNLGRDHRDGALSDFNASLMKIANPGDRQTVAARQGLAWIAEHPLLTLDNAVQTVYHQWGETAAVPEALDKRPGVSDIQKSAALLLMECEWLVLLALVIVVLWRAPRVSSLIPLLIIAVVGPSIGAAVAHPEHRDLLPALPLLIAIGSGVLALAQTPVPSRWRTFAAVAGITLVAVLIVSINGATIARQAGSVLWYSAGRMAEQVGWTGTAERDYARSLRSDPTRSEPHLRLALLAHARGDDATALDELATAVKRDANNYRARAVVANILRAEGNDAIVRSLFVGRVSDAPAGLDWAWDHEAATPPAALVLDGTDSGFARGFYGTERGTGGRDFRWSGDQAVLRLAAAPGTTPQTLVLTLTDAPAIGPLTVTVRVNGRIAGQVVVHPEQGWNTARVPLPPGIDATKPLTIELRTTTHRIGDDRRALGVAVAAVALETAF